MLMGPEKIHIHMCSADGVHSDLYCNMVYEFGHLQLCLICFQGPS